jgi:hypothetical protein
MGLRMSGTRFRRSLLMRILALGLCAAAACQTRVKGLATDPSFTYEAVVSGKMAIGGVTSALTKMPEEERNRYADMMRMSFLEKRETFTIVPAGFVAHFMGHPEYRHMLDEYRTYGRLSDSLKEKVGARFTIARYIAFARIERDNISRSRTEETHDASGEELEKKKTIMETTRSTEVSLNIYDLQTGVKVWSGAVEEYAVRKNEYVENKESKFFLIALFEAIIDAIFETPPEYPDPPSLDELLGRVFSGFARYLPEER